MATDFMVPANLTVKVLRFFIIIIIYSFNSSQMGFHVMLP